MIKPPREYFSLGVILILNAPFGHLILAYGHENSIFARPANGVQFFQQEFHEPRFAIFGDDWQSIDNDKGIQALLQSNFILRFKICLQNIISGERGISYLIIIIIIIKELKN